MKFAAAIGAILLLPLADAARAESIPPPPDAEALAVAREVVLAFPIVRGLAWNDISRADFAKDVAVCMWSSSDRHSEPMPASFRQRVAPLVDRYVMAGAPKLSEAIAVYFAYNLTADELREFSRFLDTDSGGAFAHFLMRMDTFTEITRTTFCQHLLLENKDLIASIDR